jgi:hypothetical protein
MPFPYLDNAFHLSKPGKPEPSTQRLCESIGKSLEDLRDRVRELERKPVYLERPEKKRPPVIIV